MAHQAPARMNLPEDDDDDASDDSSTIPRVLGHQPSIGRHARLYEAQRSMGSPHEDAWLDDPHFAYPEEHETAHMAMSDIIPSRKLTARDAFVLLVSVQIGSGIFMSPSQVNANVPSPGIALICWILGGLLAWTGGLSFAELGAALPGPGGMQEYLRYVYGDTVAFSMAWMWIIIVKPTAMAILSIVLVESIAVGLSMTRTDGAGFLQSLAAILVFMAILLINCVSTSLTKRLAETLVFLKFATVGLVTMGGLFTVLRHFVGKPSRHERNTDWYEKNWFTPSHDSFDWASMPFFDLLGHFCAAVYGSLWSYSGWENANFLANDMNNVRHTLPKAINAAMIVVITLFQLTNVSYFIILPWKTLSSSDTVAVTAARYLLGAPGGVLFGFLVAMSCAGALNGNILVTSKLALAVARKGYFPRLMNQSFRFANPMQGWQQTTLGPRANMASSYMSISSEDDNRFDSLNTPAQSSGDSSDIRLGNIIIPSALTLVLILVGSFRSLVTFIGMIEYTFFFATVVGLLILRVREPSLFQSYKQPIAIPILFAIVSGTILTRTIFLVPLQALLLVTAVVIGLIVRHISGQE